MLDPDDRILLVRFEFPSGRTFWATPGGGIEAGETPEDAIRRELAEETGLTDVEIGPVVWTRLHIVPFIGGRGTGSASSTTSSARSPSRRTPALVGAS